MIADREPLCTPGRQSCPGGRTRAWRGLVAVVLEVNRVIELYKANAYHWDSATADGYAPGVQER
ncbi:MAG: hypothetical protein HN742_06685 [Lentisphaerae bacterium]|nr:hypothetical protein [Lentisphaerota bacterium]MBT7058232.1 hypothetical protein [Lentisphaerota bacterium]MBT7841539.1 hypothetical protein [Lentisphaerota bacterium]